MPSSAAAAAGALAARMRDAAALLGGVGRPVSEQLSAIHYCIRTTGSCPPYRRRTSYISIDIALHVQRR